MSNDPFVLAKSLESLIAGFTLGSPIFGGNQGTAFRGTIDSVPCFAKVFPLGDREIEDAPAYRFYREGKVLSGSHPNTPKVISFSTGFKDGARVADIAYVVTDFFDGVTGRNVRLSGAPFNALSENTATEGMSRSSDAGSSNGVAIVEDSRRKTLSSVELVDCAEKIFYTLAHFHNLGIVHRDIKPENLMFALDSDDVRVIDWGLARYIGVLDKFDAAEKARVGTLMGGTQQGTMVGTPFYAAPEQINGTSVPTGKIDTWGTCAALYNLATGSVPYYSSSTYGVVAAIGSDKISSWASSSNPVLSTHFSFLIHRGLTVSPYLRPSSEDMLRLVKDLKSKNLHEPSGFVWSNGSGRERVLIPEFDLGDKERVYKGKIDALLNRIFYAEKEFGLSDSVFQLPECDISEENKAALFGRINSLGLVGVLDWVSNPLNDDKDRAEWVSLFGNSEEIARNSDVPLSVSVDKELGLIEMLHEGLSSNHISRLRVALESKEDSAVAGFLGYCNLDVLEDISPLVGSVFRQYIDSKLNDVYSVLSRGSSNVSASSDSVDEVIDDPVFIEEDLVDKFRSAFSEGGSRRAVSVLGIDSDESTLASYRLAQQEYFRNNVDRLISLYRDAAELLLDGPDLGASRLYLLSRASDLVLLRRMTSSVDEGVSLEASSVLLWNELVAEEKRCKINKLSVNSSYVDSQKSDFVAREERSRREEAYRDMRSEFERSPIYHGLQVLSSQRAQFESENVAVTGSMRLKAIFSTDRKLRNERREFAGKEYVEVLSDVEKMLEFYSNPISVESSQVYDEHAALSVADSLLSRISELKEKYKHNEYVAPTLDRVEITISQGRNYLSKIVVLK